jgi:hypothetical protein
MFTMADKMIFLNEVDPSVIIRVVGDMSSAPEEYELDQVEKN